MHLSYSYGYAPTATAMPLVTATPTRRVTATPTHRVTATPIRHIGNQGVARRDRRDRGIGEPLLPEHRKLAPAPAVSRWFASCKMGALCTPHSMTHQSAGPAGAQLTLPRIK